MKDGEAGGGQDGFQRQGQSPWLGRQMLLAGCLCMCVCEGGGLFKEFESELPQG